MYPVTRLYHSKMPDFLLCMFFCVHITSITSDPLARDIASISDKVYYKLGYKSNGMMALPKLTSAFSIQKLAQIEWQVYNQVITYCNTESNSTSCSAAEPYIKDYEETSLMLKNRIPGDNFSQVVGGNLNSIYRMIRRFREYIHQWMLLTTRHTVPMDGNLVRKLKEIYNVSKGPNRIDMHIAMFAISLTQFQLDMKTDEIANGIFQGRLTGIKLKAIHCLEIGIHSIATGLYPIGIEWLEHALHEAKHGDHTTSELVVEEYLRRAKMKHDKDWRPRNLKDMEMVFFEMPLNQTKDSSQRKWRKEGHLSRVRDENLNKKFWRLCVDTQSQVSSSDLFCWNEKHVHPFWTIGPLKSELLSTTPDQVIQFHDIIGPAQTTKIRNAIAPTFIPSVTSYFKAFYPRMKLDYVCKKLHEFLEIHTNLEKLAFRVTGLKIDAEYDSPYYEPFEPSSYAAGGSNSLHHDWSNSPLGVRDERMATFIIYLDEPEAGGNTALPKLDVAIKPLQGSAVLWYNVHSSGEHALKTPHGGCPVVLGQKLIALKWIPYHNQDHLICDQDQMAGVDYLGNGRAKSRVSAAKTP